MPINEGMRGITKYYAKICRKRTQRKAIPFNDHSCCCYLDCPSLIALDGVLFCRDGAMEARR